MEDMDASPTEDFSPIIESPTDQTESNDGRLPPVGEEPHIAPTASTASQTSLTNEMETQFRGDLDDLVKLVDDVVGQDSSCHEDSEDAIFHDLRRLASKCHGSLLAFGNSVEMGLSSALDPTDTDSEYTLSDSTREALRDTGKKMWMTIRSHPSFFQDRVNPDKAVETSSNEVVDFNSSERDSLRSRPKVDASERDKAAASGYIRAIVARLVLIDYIRSKGLTDEKQHCQFPDSSDTGGESSLYEESLASASAKELEFGLKCFARAGRTLLAYGDEPDRALVVLRLAISFWQGIIVMAPNNTSAMSSPGSSTASVDGLVAKHLDEAFDAFALLPEAASLVGSLSSDCTKNSEELSVAGGHSEQILFHLKNLQQFVLRYCIHVDDVSHEAAVHDGNHANGSGPAEVLAIQRYLPTLARAAYKHGNRFARSKEYSGARGALFIALDATNKCIALIQQREEPNERLNDFSSFRDIQQHEMLVVSKECLYVLSHVENALGKKEEAHKCLDRLEEYIEQQSRLDDEIYTASISLLNNADVEDDAKLRHSFPETIAIEGPRQKDLADIAARAKAAKSKAAYEEAKERSNLAFSRIMLHHRSPTHPSQYEEELIDSRLKELADQSKKCLGAVKDSYSPSVARDTTCENDSFKLAVTAARETRVRRLLGFAQNGDAELINKHNPYDILLNVYPESHPMHLFVIIDHLTSLLVTIQGAYDKQPRLSTETLDSLDRLAVSLARDLVAKMSRPGEKARNDSTLFPESDPERERLLQESQVHFARALDFYKSRGSYSFCVVWADFLLQALSDQPEGTSQTAIAEAMAIKAYSMSMSGYDNVDALKMARDAWGAGPTLSTLSVLFHCAVTRGSSTNAAETLSELEDGLNRLSSAVPPLASRSQTLSLFPIFTNSCSEHEGNGGGPLLLGVLRMWMDMFVADSFESEGYLSKGYDYTLFSIVTAYLGQVEQLWGRWREVNVSSAEQNGKKLTSSLSQLLIYLLKVRDGNKDGNRHTDATGTGSLLWEDESIKKVIGEQKECLWIAEQLWNLALVADIPINVSSELFSQAHDFALLSAEEVGESLTKDHLDCDLEESLLDSFDSYSALLSNEKQRIASDLSSAFSAQCLLLSAAQVVDSTDSAPNDGANDNPTVNRLVKRSLVRLYMAKRELSLHPSDGAHGEFVKGVSSWLELRCLVEIGNDSFCSRVLLEDDLCVNLSPLAPPSSSSSTRETDSGENDPSRSVASSGFNNTGATERSTLTLGGCSIASSLFVMSLRAKSQRMPTSEKLLLEGCVDEMIRRKESSIKTNGGHVRSLGEIQQVLIGLASNVQDVTTVFDCVDSVLKDRKAADSNGNTSYLPYYSTSELDWFAIESFNRGLNLFHLGDTVNAEKLLVIALNLLDSCSDEVKSYGTDMRRAYSTLVDHRAGGGSFRSASSELVMNLSRRI